MSRAELDRLWEHLERVRLEQGRNEEALFGELVVNLADLDAQNWKPYKPGQGFGLVFPAGNAGPLLQLQGRGIGYVPRFAAGDAIRGFFEEVQIRRSATSPATGSVTLLVVLSPFARYEPAPGSVAGAYQQTTYSQTYNDATANRPSLPTEGISLEGVKGFQVSLEIGMGTISGGTINLWLYNAARANWAYTETEYSPTTGIAMAGGGGARWTGPGELIAVPGVGSRIYAEARSLTTSLGAGTQTIRLETFG